MSGRHESGADRDNDETDRDNDETDRDNDETDRDNHETDRDDRSPPGFTSNGDDTKEVPRTLPRRRMLAAAAVPGLLAGCLVESEEPADEPTDADGGPAADQSASDDSQTQQTDESTETDESEETDEPPTELGPDGSGLVVTNTEVLSVRDGGYETTVHARLTVENAGRFTYDAIELRVDAYASRPGSDEQTAVGYAYETQLFESGDRFDKGDTERFDVDITFRSGESRARADPAWYEIGAAVRRAEPV